jgi:hypothetical protein
MAEGNPYRVTTNLVFENYFKSILSYIINPSIHSQVIDQQVILHASEKGTYLSNTYTSYLPA